jgi:predicted PurR-regulated permease PerM
MRRRLFGVVERRLFRATAVLGSLVAIGWLLSLVVLSLAATLSMFYNLVLPLSVAAVFALVLYPVADFLERRGRMPRLLAVSIIMLLLFSAVIAIVVVIVPPLVNQIIAFAETFPALLAEWEQALFDRFPGLTRMLTQRLGNETEVPASEAGRTRRTLMSYVSITVGMAFMPLFLFFLLLSGKRLRGPANEFLSIFSPPTQHKLLYFTYVFVGHVTAFFRGQLVIALIMAGMFAGGFTLIGLQGGVLIGLLLGLFNIVPFLGTLLGLLIVLPMSLFQAGGGLDLMTLALLVFVVVQLVESWILTPKIMADRSGLHPAVVVISVFFWGTALGGIIGMILAVPLTAFIVAVWSQAKGALARSISPAEEDEQVRILTEADIARPPPD